MHNRQSFLFCMLSNSFKNCLCDELFTGGYFYSRGPALIVFRRAWKVLGKCFPLCYKKVIALSPRRIKDKLSSLKIRVKIYP